MAKKIHTTINANYRPNWNKDHGIREYLQNAKDAETEFGARMNVYHKNDTLYIENFGCTMSRDDLLLGTTSKVGKAELIGRFGDGSKIGPLALVRDGLKVTIRNGSEVWVPSIERSDKFKADVLTFTITEGRTFENRVSIEVKGVSFTEYKEICNNFLWLSEKRDQSIDIVKTSEGDLLLSPAYKGKIFVKGIFVQYDDKIQYGYNLLNAETDIERRIVNYYDKNSAMSKIWDLAMRSRPDLFDNFFSMLDDGSQDLEGITDWAANYLSDEIKNKVVTKFKERNGDDAIPVTNLSDSKEAAHLGKIGIIANKAMSNILINKMGSFAVVKQQLSNETICFYSWSQLTDSEKNIIENTLSVVGSFSKQSSLDDVNIVDFRDPNILGLYKESKIQIARKVTGDRIEFMKTYIHELAHKITGAPDGDKRHVACIEDLWCNLWANIVN